MLYSLDQVHRRDVYHSLALFLPDRFCLCEAEKCEVLLSLGFVILKVGDASPEKVTIHSLQNYLSWLSVLDNYFGL